ncbi:MAG: laccase domain-containing protein [Actinomycetota bacterium]
MLDLVEADIGGRRLRVAVTERVDGDVHPIRTPPDVLRERQHALTGRDWAMADQRHGVDVWCVAANLPPSDPGVSRACSIGEVRPMADIVVVEASERGDRQHRAAPAVAMWAADCATALLVTSSSRLVGVHAGWRGLAAGVIDRAVECARADEHDIVHVSLGPVIHPCCYSFGAADLLAVAAGVHADPDTIRGRTTVGEPALDVGAAVVEALDHHGLVPNARAGGCTGCGDRWFSHRVGVDTARHALVGWWR